MRIIQHGNFFLDRIPSLKGRTLYYKDIRSYTMVVDLGDHAFWQNVIKQNDLSTLFKQEFEISIGLSVVNLVDQFDRKIGLMTATTDMVQVKTPLKGVELIPNGDIEITFGISDINFTAVIGHSNNRGMIKYKIFNNVLKLYNILYGETNV